LVLCYNLICTMEEAPFFDINAKSFRALFDQYYQPLCESLNYYTRDAQAIEEIIQDVFVTLWEERNQLHIQHVKTYLFTSARNKALNYLRDRKRRMAMLESWAIDAMSLNQSKEVMDPDELSAYLQQAVDALPPKCREIFNLSRKEQLTYAEIAAHLHISVKTVEAQMSIALRKIREKMQALGFKR